MNTGEFLILIYEKLKDLATTLFGFVNYTVDLPNWVSTIFNAVGLNVPSNFSLLALLGGAGVSALIIYSIVKS